VSVTQQDDSVWAILDGGLVVHRTQPRHAEGLEQLQLLVFPTLADDERFKARHYLRHLEMFPDGQFCVVDGDRVVGMTSTLRRDFDPAHTQHTFAEIFAGGWLSSHQPDGRWLYGADVGTDPAYRGAGIARALYAARHDTVRRLGLAGQVTVGMPSGLGAVKHEITAADYYAQLVAGTRTDPTISAQLRIGFEPCGLIPAYINDPVCDGYGVVLVLPAERDIPLRRQR
jgi:GNAT superfamily N-acetyltransferase